MSAKKPDQDKVRLRESIVEWLQGYVPRPAGINRLAIPINPCDIHSLAALQSTDKLIYWRNRDASFEILGMGSAYSIFSAEASDPAQAISDIRRVLDASDDGVRFLGGIAFDPSTPAAPEWTSLGAIAFTVPLIELRRENDQWTLAVHIGRDTCSEALLHAFERLELTASITPSCSTAADTAARINAIIPSPRQWRENVATLTALFNESFRKVVHACILSIETPAPADPFALLKHLVNRNRQTYLFLIRSGSDVFLGASPEQLYRRQDNAIFAEAVAGTAWDDTHELLTSTKDNSEHDWVVTDILEELRKLCSDVATTGQKESLDLGTLRHIRQKIRGKLKPEYSDPQLLAALHPTAALLGYPRDRARQALRQIEPFSRGWYGGPVGWLGRDSAEFCVAIRCALCRENTVRVYAGAGIVRTSDPQAEWHEIRNKARQYLEYFGVTL